MKIREGFVLRNVADEHMVMPTGENVAKFGGAVVLSDVAAFAFEQLKRPASREDLLSLILAEYDVDAETATADLDALLAQFREMNLLGWRSPNLHYSALLLIDQSYRSSDAYRKIWQTQLLKSPFLPTVFLLYEMHTTSAERTHCQR